MFNTRISSYAVKEKLTIPIHKNIGSGFDKIKILFLQKWDDWCRK